MGEIRGVFSAFINNVAALALLMLVGIQAARKAGRAPGLSLMPLSFATILGGMVTLIGRPPNIIIAAIREEQLGAPFKIFDFPPVASVAAISALGFVALIGWRFIPARGGGSGKNMYDYIAELTVPTESKLIGKRFSEIEEDPEKAHVALIGLIREGQRLYGRSCNSEVKGADTLVLEAFPSVLDEFRAALSSAFSYEKPEEHLKSAGDGLDIIDSWSQKMRVSQARPHRRSVSRGISAPRSWKFRVKVKRFVITYVKPRCVQAISSCCWSRKIAARM